MRLTLAFAAIVVGAAGAGGSAVEAKLPPLRDPVFLNIGFVCKWEERCISRQKRAMNRALRYVKRNDPPAWKIQASNRIASGTRGRVDWIGYNNCIRNPKIPRTSGYARRR